LTRSRRRKPSAPAAQSGGSAWPSRWTPGRTTACGGARARKSAAHGQGKPVPGPDAQPPGTGSSPRTDQHLRVRGGDLPTTAWSATKLSYRPGSMTGLGVPSSWPSARRAPRHNHHSGTPWKPVEKTAEPAKPAVKGSKIAEPPPTCTAAPAAANRRTPSPAHRLTGSPDAHRAAVAAGRGQAGALTPGLPPATADAMTAGMRSAFARTATTVASNTANALL
jgi:hypothetical protein